MIVLGIDVGGTNTDLVLSGVGDRHVYHKLPTTKDDPSVATVQGFREICEKAGIKTGDVDLVLHGTTVATNTVLEYDGAKTGMITTRGFRDILHIARHQRPENFSLMIELPWQARPLVERKHRKVVSERILPPGEIVEPLNEEEAIQAIQALKEAGVESIAVAFLNSFLNPTHEKRVGELIAEHYPEAEVSLSHDVIAQFREYERFSTCALNAFVKPKVKRYLQRLEQGLREAGLEGALLVMQSNGGVASVEQASHRPVTLLMSGPAAGVLGAKAVGNEHGYDKLLSIDIGGTSADVSVIPGKLLQINPQDGQIAGYAVLLPQIDVTSIGAGGGSIAWVDNAGGFNVGPRSAGANPGPACYGLGGTEPTVTDAHITLGRLDPDYFLGGRLKLKPELARKAIEEHICPAFNMDVTTAALSILQIVNANMAMAIRQNSIRRGHDPREYALVALGGAGPLHACDLAEELGISSILCPPAPGVTSAIGLLTTDLRYEYVRTVGIPLADATPEQIESVIQEIEAEITSQLERDMSHAAQTSGDPSIMGGIEVERYLDCRYIGQGYELQVPYAGSGGDWKQQVKQSFDAMHQATYGFSFENDPVEIINVRVVGIGNMKPVAAPDIERGGADPSHAAVGTASVIFGTPQQHQRYEVKTFDRSKLAAGNVIAGPAIIHGMDSTIVINPGWTGDVLRDGTIRLQKEAR